MTATARGLGELAELLKRRAREACPDCAAAQKRGYDYLCNTHRAQRDAELGASELSSVDELEASAGHAGGGLGRFGHSNVAFTDYGRGES